MKTLFQGSTVLLQMELNSAFNVQMKKLIVKEMVGCVEV